MGVPISGHSVSSITSSVNPIESLLLGVNMGVSENRLNP